MNAEENQIKSSQIIGEVADLFSSLMLFFFYLTISGMFISRVYNVHKNIYTYIIETLFQHISLSFYLFFINLCFCFRI